MSDIVWLWCMWRAKRAYRRLGFAERVRFLDRIRPPIKGEPGIVIAYPDAIFHVTPDILSAALRGKP